MNGKCEDCWHWHQLDGVGPRHARIPDGWGDCLLTASGGGEPFRDDTRAYALDNEEYEAALIVAPDFGCVQFERRSA